MTVTGIGSSVFLCMDNRNISACRGTILAPKTNRYVEGQWTHANHVQTNMCLRLLQFSFGHSHIIVSSKAILRSHLAITANWNKYENNYDGKTHDIAYCVY